MTNTLLPYNATSIIVPGININFENYEDFQHAESALYQLRSTRSGTLLLNRIRNLSDDDKKLLIKVNQNINTGHFGFLTESQITTFGLPIDYNDPDHKSAVKMFSHRKVNGENGLGTNVLVSYNPNETVAIDVDGYPINMNDGLHAVAMLAHELVHAYHIMNGTSLYSKPNDVWFRDKGQRLEEERATGIGEFRMEPFSENSVRRELGFPIRASYFQRHAPPLS